MKIEGLKEWTYKKLRWSKEEMLGSYKIGIYKFFIIFLWDGQKQQHEVKQLNYNSALALLWMAKIECE